MPSAPRAALRATNLTVARGRRILLEHVDLEVFPGEILHVAGENGCGKSSLLRVLAGEVEPRSGSVATNGRRAYVPERLVLPEHLRARRWLGLAGAPGAPLPTELDRRCGALSKGQVQRVALAGALGGDREILVLDEPWAGLDAAARAELGEALRRAANAGAAVIFSDHSGAATIAATTSFHLGPLPPADPPHGAPSAVTVVLVRGSDREVLTTTTGERDRMLAGRLAAGWGVERVDTHR